MAITCELQVGVGALCLLVLAQSETNCLCRPDDVITTGITTNVVMVVAAMSPEPAWKQPLLRTVDTLVGVAVGVLGASIRLVGVIASDVTASERAELISTMTASHGDLMATPQFDSGRCKFRLSACRSPRIRNER
jgi:hypothetical protein